MLPLPGPGAVLSAAGRARATAGALLALPGRVLRLVDGLEATAARLDVLLDAVTATAERAGEIAAGAAVVVVEADRVAKLSGTVAVEARGVVVGADEVRESAGALVESYAPILAELQPTLARLAETTSPREVTALLGLVDRLPPLLDAVDRDVLPLLGKLNVMAPDLHALLESVEDLRRTVAGLPGIGLLRRRGDEELAADGEPFVPDGTRQGATRART
jgi:hypothetical protein